MGLVEEIVIAAFNGLILYGNTFLRLKNIVDVSKTRRDSAVDDHDNINV